MSYLKIPIDLKAAVSGKLERCSYDLSSTYKCNFLGADNKQ